MNGAPESRHPLTLAEAAGSRWVVWTIWTLTLGCAWMVWPHPPLDAWNAPRWGMVLLILSLAPWSLERPSRDVQWLLAGAGLLLGMQTLLAPDPGLFLWGSPQRSQGVLALGVLVLTLCWARGAMGGQLATLGAATALAVTGVGVLALLQSMGIDPIQTASQRPTSTLGNPMLLGQWLVLSGPLAVAWGWHRSPTLGGGLAVLVLLALLVCGARGAWLGTLGAALVWGLTHPSTRGRRRRWIVIGCGLCLVLAAALSALRPASVTHRWDLWQTSVQVLWQPPATLPPLGPDPHAHWRPWLGWGLDGQVLPLRAARPHDAHPADPDRAHQLGLDILLRHGLLGTALLLGAVGMVWRRLRRSSGAHGAAPHPPLECAVLAGLAGWLLSLQTGFVAAADGLTAAVLLGAALGSARPGSPPRRHLPLGLRALGIALAGLLWLGPPDLLRWTEHWRGGERALIRFDALSHRLRDARAADPATQCAVLHATLEQARMLPVLDPTRHEYYALIEQLTRVQEARCRIQGNARRMHRVTGMQAPDGVAPIRILAMDA